MGKIKKTKLKISSNGKKSNINQCYVSLSKLQLNEKKSSNNSFINISEVQHNQSELCELEQKKANHIRQCKVRIIRLKSIKSTSNETCDDIKPATEDNFVAYNKVVKVNTEGPKRDHNLREGELRNFKTKSNNNTHCNNKTSPNLINNEQLTRRAKNKSREIATLTKHNINKEIQIKLVKLVKENDNLEIVKNGSTDTIKSENVTKETDLMEENDKNLRNINKRKRRIGKVPVIDKKKEYQSINKNPDELRIIKNENFHTNDKRILRNRKQIEIDRSTAHSNINTRQRQNALSNVELEGKSDKINLDKQISSNGKNKINIKKQNTIKKTEVKLKKNLKPSSVDINKSQFVNSACEPILAEKSYVIENINNYNSVPICLMENPKIQKETFFRGLRSDKMSNSNESKFRLAQNIQHEQESEKIQTKNNKTQTEKNKQLFSSEMENQTTTEKKKNEGSDQIIENIENIDPINKIITTKNLSNFSKLSLNTNNQQRLRKIENNKVFLGDFTNSKSSLPVDNLKMVNENNRIDNGKMTKKTSKEKINLSNSEISDILDEYPEDNLINETTKSDISKSKKFFKSPHKRPRREFVENKGNNNSDIFSFQSSQSDSESTVNKRKDHDVINKLVKEGKVEVSTYKKGTGRLNLKRYKKRKVLARRNVAPLISNEIQHESTHNATNLNDMCDNTHNVERKPLFSPTQKEIGFSPLARSTMKKNAHLNNRIDKNILTRKSVVDKKELLAAVKSFLTRTSNATKKYVNIRKHVSFNADSFSQSPNLEHQSPNLERTSNITTKHDNIPITKQANLTKTSNLISQFLPFNASTPWRPPNLERSLNNRLPTSVNLNKHLQFSNTSITSYENQNSEFNNLSNIENLQPESKGLVIESNPRKGLKNRTPLKNINILEVLNLPPLALEKLYPKNVLQSGINSPNKSENVSSNDMFNFDEIITDTENEDSKIVLPTKRTLKEKLKKLKRLLPNKNRKQISKPTRISFNTMKKMYTPHSPVKQTKINNIFCSTMIEENMFSENDFAEEPFKSNFSGKTYSRKNKGKNKRHDFISSNVSEEEEDKDCMPNIHNKRPQHANKDKMKNDELKNFYADFNSMCDEVQKYKLIKIPEKTTK